MLANAAKQAEDKLAPYQTTHKHLFAPCSATEVSMLTKLNRRIPINAGGHAGKETSTVTETTPA